MKIYAKPANIKRALFNANQSYRGNLIFNRFEPSKTGKFGRVTLRVRDSRGPGAKLGVASRWHTISCTRYVFRDFLTELFRLDQNARVISSLATYHGQADFHAKYPETAYHNVGSRMFPVCAGSLELDGDETKGE